MEPAYMEHTAAWGAPFDFQLATTNWTTEEGPAGDSQAWAAPAIGHSLEYASIVDIFGSSCSIQPYVVTSISSSSSRSSPSRGHQQLAEYNCYPMTLFQERMREFKADDNLMKKKMHRYPPSIRALNNDDLYTIPRVVAIGPYHHCGGDHLKEAEKVKHVAAGHCITISGLEVRDMYQEVVSAAEGIDARALYDDGDMMAGMSHEDEFLPMMFYDACFLVMYMLQKSGMMVKTEMYNFFESKDNDIAHDVMLLENQIPWPVVAAVLSKCTPEPIKVVKDFIVYCKDGFLQDRFNRDPPGVDWDGEYYQKAPHLLGLLWFYVVGRNTRDRRREELKKYKQIPISCSAIELAEMGIFLTAKETDEVPADMGLGRKWIIFAELPMAPLSLNDLRASRLVNMAALELCTTPDFLYFDDDKPEDDATPEDSAVCSYLGLLSMLMHREEDVHELRTKGILQGAGLSNNKTLDFFTSLQNLRRGRCYCDVMLEIADYKKKKWGWWLWLYKFMYQNRKIIAWIISALGAFGSILAVLLQIKGSR